MAKYKRVPIVVEAVKITRTLKIETKNRTITGNPGDYLITDMNSGEQFPCNANEFEKKYEPVKDFTSVNLFLRKAYRKVIRTSKKLFLKKLP